MKYYPDRDTGITEIVIYDNENNRIIDEFAKSSLLNSNNNENELNNSYEKLRNIILNNLKKIGKQN